MSTRKAPLSYGAESLGGQRYYSKDWTSLYTIALDINGHDLQYLLGQYMYTLTGRMSHCQFKIFDSSTWTFWILLVSDTRNSWSSWTKTWINRWQVILYITSSVAIQSTASHSKCVLNRGVLTHPRRSVQGSAAEKHTHTLVVSVSLHLKTHFPPIWTSNVIVCEWRALRIMFQRLLGHSRIKT